VVRLQDDQQRRLTHPRDQKGCDPLACRQLPAARGTRARTMKSWVKIKNWKIKKNEDEDEQTALKMKKTMDEMKKRPRPLR
jgi:hypothetical protein